MLKNYYHLAKPGIIYGNALTTIAAFALAARRYDSGVFGVRVDLLLLAAFVGISLVIASGGVFNNIIDRDIDARMERTKNRELVRDNVSVRAALIFGIALGVAGFAILALWTNALTAAAAAVGWFFYIVIYSLWVKRANIHGATIGSIAGAVPVVVGYVAASGRIDAAAIILFLILALWQVPHFYAIAIYRADDYAAADIPVLPVRRGIRATKINMLIYILAFILATGELFAFGYTGFNYFLIAMVLGLAWLGLCVKGFWVGEKVGGEGDDSASGMTLGAPMSPSVGTISPENRHWARKMFFVSLIVLTLLFLTIGIGAVV